MKQSLHPSPEILKVFVACLLSFTILITPIAAVAVPGRGSSPTVRERPLPPKKTESSAKELFVNPPVEMSASETSAALPGPQPEPAPLPVGSVTAVMTGAIVPTANNGDGKADPGDTINYTVTLGNTTGTDATGLSFNDLLDSHTTFVPGSIKSSPVCFDQSVSTNEDVAKAITLTGQDPDGDSLTFSIVTPPTNGGFGATTAPNLTYTPNANFFGADSFTFRVNDGSTSGTGANGNSNETCTVSITVNSVNDAPTFTVPGNPAAVNEDAGAQSVPNFIGASVRPAQPGNTTEDTQTVSFVITNNTNTGLFSTPPALNVVGASYPKTATLTYTSAPNQNGTAVITYHAHDNGGTANGGVDNSADQTFTITVNAVNDPPVVVAPAGLTAQANMKVIGMTGLLGNVNDNADNGVNGCVSTTFTVTSGSISTTTPAGGTISNVNLNTGTFDFDPPPGVTGDVTFTYTVSDTGCPGVAVSSPATTVHINVVGPVIWFVNPAAGVNGAGTLTSPFNSLASANTKLQSLAANQRIFVYTGTTAVGDVVTLNGSATQAAAHWLIGQGAIAADFDTLMGITPPAGTIARPSINGTRPTVRGTVTMKDNTVVRGLNIDVSAGATKGLTGSSLGVGSVLAISDVNVTSAAGNAVDFSSAQTINYTTSNASTSPNILSSTTGTALSVVNTTIGASGLTFRSITAGTNSGSAGVGIRLDTTGNSGGLTVTGNTSGTCGGTVTGTIPSLSVTTPNSGDCSGGTIQHKTGTDGSTTSGIGIYLNNTASVSLTRMWLHDFDNFAIHGSGVSNLSFVNSLVNGSNGTLVGGADPEGSVSFIGLSGTAAVTNSFFAGGANDIFHLENNGSEVLNRITFTGDTFSDTLNATSASALFLQAECTSQLKATVTTSVFTGARSNNLNVSVRAQSNDDLIVSNSQFSNNNANQVSGGSNLSIAAGGPSSICSNNTLNPTLTYNIHNNTFKDALGTAISISKGGVGTGQFGTTANPGIIDSNTIGVNGNSTSSGAGGIGVVIVGGGSITTNITNNTINGAINGLVIGANSTVAGGGQGYFHAVVTGNSVGTPNVGAGNITTGLLAQFGAVSTDNPKVCVTLGGAGALKNNLAGGMNGGADLRLRVRFGTIIGVVGYGGANNDDAAMNAFLGTQNTIGAGGVSATNNAATGSGWTGSCPSPLPPLQLAEGGVSAALNAPSLLSSFMLSVLSTSPGASDAKCSIITAPSAISTSLNQQQLDSIVAAAVDRWAATGLTPRQIGTLRGIKFEVSDLSASYLGEAEGDRILIDRNAGGKGWYTGASPLDDSIFARAVSSTRRYADPMSSPAGHVDLLTALMHEMGHKLGLDDSYAQKDRDNLMYGYLTVGERRLPSKGQAASATPSHNVAAHFLSLESADSPLDVRKVSSEVRGQTSEVRKQETTRVEPQSGAMSIARDVRAKARGISPTPGSPAERLGWGGAVREGSDRNSSRDTEPLLTRGLVPRSVPTGLRLNHANNRRASKANRSATAMSPMPFSGGTFPINGIGAGFILPTGKTITITFSVTLNSPPNFSGVPPATPQVFNHGNLSGTNVSGFDTNTVTTDVDLFDSTTALISSANPSSTGQAVTFTATIGATGSPSGAGTNRTGTVNFKDGGVTIPGCGTQPVSSNQATCTTSALATSPPARSITAEYSGDGNFDPSTSNTVTQTVNACSATVVVTSTGDSGAGTLRQAIADVCDGGTITFDPVAFAPAGGPYTISLLDVSGELLVGKSMTITGPGASVLTVQRASAAATNFRVFEVPTTKTVTISGLTISNGVSGSGAGVRNDGSLTLDKVVVTGNSGPAADGGGIYNQGALTITNSTISNNTETVGGFGAGIESAVATATVMMINCTVSGNTGGSQGGGIRNSGGTFTIINSTISSNSLGDAAGLGGGIYNADTLIITNSTISGNNAKDSGGGVYNKNGAGTATATLTSVTVTNNTADKDDVGGGTGGGINVVSGTVTLKNTIVAGDFKGAAVPVADDIAGTVDATSSFNLIGTGGSGGLVDVSTDAAHKNQVGVADAKLGALANNGGPTQTHALLDTSPALEKGNAFSLTTDQRGFPRPVDFDSVAPVPPYDDSDIGAFERQLPPAAPATPDLQPGSDSFGAGTGGTNTDDITKTTPRVFDIGSVTTGATVKLLRDTNPLGGTEVVVASGGASSSTISLSDPNVLADGDYYYRARQTLGSDTSPLSSLPGLKVTIDTTAPAAPSTPDLQAASDTFSALGTNSDNITSAVSRAFDITNTETGALVELLRNGTPIASTVAAGASVVLTDTSSPGDGPYNYSARQTDVAGNSTSSLSALSVTIDMTPPTVSSSVRVDPNPTAAATVHFTVTFSEPVTGVDTTDFSITTTGGISGTSVTNVTPVDNSHYTVTVNTGTGDGTLRLNVVDDDTILDIVGLPLGGTGAGNGNFTAGQVYTVSKSDPFVSSIIRTDPNPTNATSVNFTVTFSKAVTGVNIGANSDFVLTTSGVAGASITNLSGSGTTYTVTVNTGTGDGTIRLDVTDDDTIVDSGSRPLGGTGLGNGNFITGEVYNIDKTPPVATIDQAVGQTDPFTGPTASSVINFKVTFSETPAAGSFTSSDISISGGAGATVANITGSGTTYNVAVEGMTQSGTVIININAGTVQDDAGNLNTASTITDNTVQFFADNFTTFEVNTTADTDDGSCDPLGTGPGNHDCTLREAINAANTDAGAETITFNSVVFAAPGPYTINLTGALPDLSTDMTIAGPGANVLTVKRNTGGNYRIFNIPSGNVTIDGLTISNGNVTGNGGGILDNSAGTVSVTNSTISGNSASTGAGGGITHFGAGTLNITNSTISGNSASSTGGGIHLGTFATVNITNSTISGDTANGDGGGIYTANVPLTITNSTITNNRADNDNNASGTGGGIFRSSGTVTLRNTIVARNFKGPSPSITADDIFGTADAASSFNLIGTGGAGGLVNGTNSNQVGVVDPGLQPLADNGGPTMTHALLCASSAIDKGKNFGSTTDQRGFTRPFDLSDSVYPDAVGGDASDIGAFETQAAGGCIPVAVPPAPAPSTDQDTPVVITLTGTYSQNTALSFTITQQPGHSTGPLTPGAPVCVFTSSMTCTSTVNYTPSLNYVGPDFFKFKVSAGGLDSAEAQVDITVNSTVDLTTTKTHVGNFTQADTGKTYTIKVSNVGLHASSGLVTLTDSLPPGLTARALLGAGWNCDIIPPGGTPGPATLTCTRSDVLAGGGANYPPITLMVDVACTAPGSVTNTATVSGGGDATPGNNAANDPTTVNPDTTPPVIVCPGSITRFTDPGQFNANINPGTPVATDNCGTPTVTGVRSDGKPLNAPYPVGITIITWTAKDAANNTATCAQSIAVMVPSGERRHPGEDEALLVELNLVIAYFSGVW